MEKIIPLSTYRLQMHRDFGFQKAIRILPYLRRLGIGDCYTSPLLKARAGSLHGYDITDHNQLNPELGTESDYDRFASQLHELDMGHLLDFVPNHMGIDPAENPWWHDVLENGPSSPYAHYFDIDWQPLKPELKNKVLLPILGDQYGAVLERGELRLGFEKGCLILQYGGQTLPLNPRRTPHVLNVHLDDLQNDLGDNAEMREFLSILTELSNLPTIAEQEPKRMEQRQREKEVARARLARLHEASPAIKRHIQKCIDTVNGEPGKPESFDALHRLLEGQPYRLAYWKTAFHEINYRRFFDVNQLSGLRMEWPEVFQATHQRLFRLIADKKVTGLRLDHPDGLYDPARYFEALQQSAGPLYVVAEKILSGHEPLRKAWRIDGTSGYDFLNLVNHLFIEARHAEAFNDIYQRFTGTTIDSQEEIYRSKKFIMSTSMASELNVLANSLNRISETNRLWRDFTLDSLQDALREVVACFPVYRTYISSAAPSPSDELTITKAVAEAKRRNPATEPTIFDFIRAMLVPQLTPTLSEREFIRRLEFAMKFQQYTAPVQAKGVEDTAFYRHPVLLSVNEVGGELGRFGLSVSDFHEANLERQRDWPGSLLATTTHDTKRGEDARARLNVLSEIPEEWEKAVQTWAAMNRERKTSVDDHPAPDANDEYFIYQALIGAWVPGLSTEDSINALAPRMRDYLVKALREAKRHTSWIRSNEDYEKAALDFLDRLLSDRAPRGFVPAFQSFLKRVERFGAINSLAQLTLKMASPGVPDFYQGTELWNFSLVDPDNRRPVDFEFREKMLAELETTQALPALMQNWEDGKIKLLVTSLGLRYRRAYPDLFLNGSYIPLQVTGELADHVAAFAREDRQNRMIVTVPRLLARFAENAIPWAGTRIELPEGWGSPAYRHLFTGEILRATTDSRVSMNAAALFQTLPVAWLAP